MTVSRILLKDLCTFFPGFRRPIPSTKAFLYALSATTSKLNVRPDKNPTAIIFTEKGMSFGVNDLVIKITEKKVLNHPGDLYEALPGNQTLTGSNEFQPDDIEVLVGGGKTRQDKDWT